jgi:hypothetical protein
MINGQYNFHAGNGCSSCVYYQEGSVGYEENWYCELHEKGWKREGFSPRIKQYGNKGCEDFSRKFRPVEEVLKEAEVSPGVARTS